jgi:outer membrane protein OmpA-like peptidoglycan-associated protein
VRLSIIDDITGDSIANQILYHVELENIDEAYINSYNVGLPDKPISFNGLTTSLKGFSATDYLWNFGDGFKPGGPFMSKTFKKEGEYTVRLGLIGEEDSLGIIPKKCVMKKIRIYNNWQEFALKGTGESDEVTMETDSVAEQKKTMHISICFMDDLPERQKVKIEGAIKESGKKTVSFDRYGLNPASLPFLDNVASVLKQNPDIRLELVLHTIENEMLIGKMGISEKWAQELAFYFKNKGIDKDVVRSKGFGLSKPVFKPYVTDNKTIDGVVEFIFMKN